MLNMADISKKPEVYGSTIISTGDNQSSVLISKDGEKKIVCLKHMEDFFKSHGFISLDKHRISFFYKFLNNKIIRKIKILIELIIKSKFYFKNLEHKKIVIFDSETTEDIEKILPQKGYTIISNRLYRMKEIYLSKKVIFYILKNFFKRSLKQNYLVGMLKEIQPKVVITHISHSADFHIVSKILNDEMQFIAIQSGSSNEFSFMPEESIRKFFVPKLMCFSEFDKLFYEKNKINVQSLEVVGSLRSALSYEYVKSQKIKINPNKYDICLVSEPHSILNGDYFQVKNMAECSALVAEFTYKLCKKHNLNLIFTGEGQIGERGALNEINFYKHYLKNYDFKIYQSTNRSKEFPSYVNIMQSKLTIGFISTILREAISFEKKILSCNFTGHPDVAFPAMGSDFPNDCICVFNNPSYELFEEKVLKILSMSDEKYFSELGEKKFSIMLPTVNTANIMRNKIKNYLNMN